MSKKSNWNYFFGSKVYSKSTIPKVFRWPNGQLIDPTFWEAGKPDNSGGNDTYIVEDCVNVQTGGKLNDVACTVNRKFICQGN